MVWVMVPVIWMGELKVVMDMMPPPALRTCPTLAELKTPELAVTDTVPVDPEIAMEAFGVGKAEVVPASTPQVSSAP